MASRRCQLSAVIYHGHIRNAVPEETNRRCRVYQKIPPRQPVAVKDHSDRKERNRRHGLCALQGRADAQRNISWMLFNDCEQ